MSPVTSKVEYLNYKAYDYVKQGSTKYDFLDAALITRTRELSAFTPSS